MCGYVCGSEDTVFCMGGIAWTIYLGGGFCHFEESLVYQVCFPFLKGFRERGDLNKMSPVVLGPVNT